MRRQFGGLWRFSTIRFKQLATARTADIWDFFFFQSLVYSERTHLSREIIFSFILTLVLSTLRCLSLCGCGKARLYNDNAEDLICIMTVLGFIYLFVYSYIPPQHTHT